MFIATRLFYGLGTWRTPSLQNMKALRTTYVALLKRVLRVRHDARLTNGQVFQKAATLDIRKLLALDRLRYARKLFCDGLEFLQHLVHMEFQHCPDSWLHGLIADIQWLRALVPHRIPELQGNDITVFVDLWQQPSTPWKRILKQAWKTALLQEHMMVDIQVLHGRAEFTPEGDAMLGPARNEVHVCDCGRSFETPQGLALHRVRAHQLWAPEHSLTCGATCPHCLRFFWTSARSSNTLRTSQGEEVPTAATKRSLRLDFKGITQQHFCPKRSKGQSALMPCRRLDHKLPALRSPDHKSRQLWLRFRSSKRSLLFRFNRLIPFEKANIWESSFPHAPEFGLRDTEVMNEMISHSVTSEIGG